MSSTNIPLSESKGSMNNMYNTSSVDDDLYSFNSRRSNSYTSSYKNSGIDNLVGSINGGGVGLGVNVGQDPIIPSTSSRNRINTAMGGGINSARPMTSVRAAGFSRQGKGNGTTSHGGFDPFNQAGYISSSNEKPPSPTPEEQIKSLEKKINQIVEESTLYLSGPNPNIQLALEKAKDAAKKERLLAKQREQMGFGDQLNLDLTYCALFTLANCYHANKMYHEALNTYTIIVKNKMFNQAGRLRVNMGNIYFEQKKYPQAVKMYRMALDQISNANKEIRLRIMRNIGNACVKMAQFQDAITSYETVMETIPDFQTGFNLVLCYFALGNIEKMKKGFQQLVFIQPNCIEQNDELGSLSKDESIEDHEVFNEDNLRALAREKKQIAHKYINLAAKLIAPVIEESFSLGYDWVVEAIKSSPNSEIANELEISKAIQYLKSKKFDLAIETLKSFENKDKVMLGTAATNLSFLYFLEGDYKQAEKYADIAINNDRYNAKALTNKGNCLAQRGNYEKAKEYYQEAINVDAVCAEAIYNSGLICKKMNNIKESLQWYEKLHAILRNNSEVIFQIADCYERLNNLQQAMEWYNILISVIPTDPGVLAKFGSLAMKKGDKTQAFQHYSESYRYFPCIISVIAWLGAYYVDCQVYEQAILYFECASTIQPKEIKWQLMIASCYRRSGNYQHAYEKYKKIHEQFPENVECLRFLVRISTDLGMKEVQEYVNKLSKLKAISNNNNSVNNVGSNLDDLSGTINKSNIKMNESISNNVDSTESLTQKAYKLNLQNKPDDLDFDDDVVSLLPD